MTVLMTSTLMTGALCYPGTHFMYLILSSNPKKSRRSYDGHDSHNKFSIPGQDGKGLILSEDLLLVDASIVFHLQLYRHTVCRELVWRTYTTVKVLQTTKRVELFNPKEFPAVALEAHGEAWCCMWHPPGALSRRSRMFIFFASAPILFMRRKGGIL